MFVDEATARFINREVSDGVIAPGYTKEALELEKVLNLPWVEKIRRADRDNTIDVYISDDYNVVLADGVYRYLFVSSLK